MFNNPFLKKDPLLEAVKAAQADGEMRRQAEAIVNEEFGVYSRKAVVREQLAAYDAALEEAYVALKEGLSPKEKSLAALGSPKDKITKKDVLIGRGVLPKEKMEEKKMWEGSDVSGEDPGMEVAKQAGARQQAQTPTKTPTKTGNAAGSTISNARSAAGMNEAQLDELTGKGKLPQMKANYQDAKKIHSNEADWHAARADRAERRGESKKAEHHMDAGYGHEEKAERAGSKLKRANALMTRAKAVSDIKSSKAASKSARAEYKEEAMMESILAKLAAKHMREDSFNSAQTSGKSVNEVAMTTPPAIVQPAVPSMKQTQAPGIRGTAQFGKQGAGARPLTPTTQNVVRGKPSMLNTVRNAISKGMSDAGNQAVKTNIAKGMTDAGKVAQVASKAPGVAARVAQMASRVSPLGAAIGAGAAASQAVGQLATGTETGRAIGKSIGQTIRSVDRPVSSLPTSKPQTAADVAANKATRDANLKATGSKFAAGKTHNVTDFKMKDGKATIGKTTTEKGWSDPGAYENRSRSETGAMQTIKNNKVTGKREIVTPSAGPKDEKSTQNFLNKELGRTTANPQGPEAPSKPSPSNVPTPPSRPTFGSDLPKIDTGPKAGPASTPQSAADAAPKPAPNVPTPPSRPAELDLPKIDKGPKLNANKPGLQESVQVGDNKYRIV